MKALIALLAALAVIFALPTASFAKKDKGGIHGKITSVDAHSITVSSKKGGSKTLQIDDTTKVSINGETSKTVSDLKVNEHVVITLGAKADTAGTITVKPHHKKKAVA